jgi:hypothetical protein
MVAVPSQVETGVDRRVWRLLSTVGAITDSANGVVDLLLGRAHPITAFIGLAVALTGASVLLAGLGRGLAIAAVLVLCATLVATGVLNLLRSALLIQVRRSAARKQTVAIAEYRASMSADGQASDMDGHRAD